MKAIIIGGGIGGLTAAIALTRVGIDSVVYEAASELKPVGGGLGIGSNAIVAAAKIGIEESLIAAGEVVTGFEVRTQTGALIFTAPFFSVGQSLGAPTLGIHRGDLQRALLSHLDSGQVRLGHTCSAITQDADRV